MPTITFLPDGPRIACENDESIFDVGRRAGVRIPTSCVGKASCGLCRVKIVAGEEHLSPLNSNERRHLGNVYYLTKIRLSCQARISGGDVTVEVP
ncbi:MAG TPA: 2Fe-2S iron-sulfur cluster-binding protein [Polyangia bacterium]|jgi:2Fe-2S ferredoxin|nr:2Fe-2S iron-sulfur cluster-binding protein [Polyangia bacterium]